MRYMFSIAEKLTLINTLHRIADIILGKQSCPYTLNQAISLISLKLNFLSLSQLTS